MSACDTGALVYGYNNSTQHTYISYFLYAFDKLS